MVNQMTNQIQINHDQSDQSLQVSRNRLWAFDSTIVACGTEKLGGPGTGASTNSANATVKINFHANWQLASQPHGSRAGPGPLTVDYPVEPLKLTPRPRPMLIMCLVIVTACTNNELQLESRMSCIYYLYMHCTKQGKEVTCKHVTG